MSLNEKIAPIIFSLASVALVGLMLVLISWLAPVLTPIMLGWYLTALALPSYFWLQKRGVKSSFALMILIAAILAGGIGMVILFTTSINSLQEGLQLYTGNLDSVAADLEAALGTTGTAMNVSGWMGSGGLGKVLAAVIPALVDVASNFLVGLVLVAFLLIETPRFRKLMANDFGGRPVLSQMPSLMKTAVAYFGIRTRLNMVTGVGFTVLLLILGVDYALLWGVLAFVLSYIPYIGLFTAMIPPTILAVAEFGLTRAFLVIIGVVALNLLIENVLEPGYTGKKLSLSPTIVFISFFLWGWLLGPMGALLSMPITVMLMLVLSQHESTLWLSKLIGRE